MRLYVYRDARDLARVMIIPLDRGVTWKIDNVEWKLVGTSFVDENQAMIIDTDEPFRSKDFIGVWFEKFLP